MSAKARSNCSPGGAGSMKSNVNVNMNTAGGNKKQGITSRVATDIWINSGIQSSSNGTNRNVVFTQNQLSGVGVGHSMFKASNADGSANIAPYVYGKDKESNTGYLEFPTAQGFESFPYGLSAGTITATGITTGSLTSGSISCGAITGTSYNSSTATTPMTIASNLTTVNCTLAGSQTSGELNIGTGARTGAINIGTNGVTGASITVGTSFTSTTINGSLNLDLIKLNSSSGDTGQYLASQGASPPIWATLPASASGWVGTAATELSMGTYDITTTSGSLNLGTGSLKLNSSSGDTGQYLASQGASPPIWATLPASGWVGTAATELSMGTYDITTTSGLIRANGGITGTTITTSGLINANGGINVPTGQTLTVVGTTTASGLITANGGITGTTITTSGLITSTIDSATPTTTFSFLDSQTNDVEFCTNVVGVINIGKKTSSTSVQCSNIDLTGTNINNASSETGGDINLCNNQTSGKLNIGTGARTTIGDINIGTGSGAVINPITIGGASSAITMNGTCTFTNQINASLGMTSAGNIAVTATDGTITVPSGGFLIGPYKNAATSSASITAAGQITGTSLELGTGAIGCGAITTSGLINANGGITGTTITASGLINANGITVSGANGITLSSTAYTPALNQLGYTVSVLLNATSPSTGTTNTITNITSTTIPAGTFIVHFSGGGAVAGQYNLGISTTSGVFDTEYTMGATTIVNFTQNYVRPALTVIIQNTAPTTWYLNQSSNTGGYVSTRTTWYYTRIA